MWDNEITLEMNKGNRKEANIVVKWVNIAKRNMEKKKKELLSAMRRVVRYMKHEHLLKYPNAIVIVQCS